MVRLVYRLISDEQSGHAIAVCWLMIGFRAGVGRVGDPEVAVGWIQSVVAIGGGARGGVDVSDDTVDAVDVGEVGWGEVDVKTLQLFSSAIRMEH